MIETTREVAGPGITFTSGVKARKVHDTHSLANRAARADTKKVVTGRLVKAREFNGYSQTEAAALLGYKNSTQLSQWEQGKRVPPLGMVIAASRVYRVSTDYLLGLSDDPDRDPVSDERRRILNAAGEMLRGMSRELAEAVIYQTNLSGPTMEVAHTVLGAGDQFLASFRDFVKLNQEPFESDMRGSATLLRKANAMGEALDKAREAVQRHRRINEAATRGVVKTVRPHDNHPLFEAAANDEN